MGKHPALDLETAAVPPRTVAPPPAQPWHSWLVPLFTVANVSLFVLTMYLNDCPRNEPVGLGGKMKEKSSCLFVRSLGRFAFQPLDENSFLGPSSTTLDFMGALDWKKVVFEHEWWRLFACIWLHAGVVHIVANMFSLLFIGVRLEEEFGFVRIGALYFLSGFGGSLLSCLSFQQNISVGASGALFGLLGAMLSELFTNWTIYANKCAALLTLMFIITINLAVGIDPHIDNSAHIGGFISGFLLGFVLLIRPQFGWISRRYIPPGYDMGHVKPKYKMYQYILWVIAFIFLMMGGKWSKT
ncbi:RHOMBOID-like protein 1 isoform X2 [Amborella trichopoda]|uniref:RHOMBOID-like protein 1 isoform X2 n=1 Tax=Amborella trichopoda TaxID=13333 RepID=UPI0009BDC795|nr:RHOMBOID-like protein 1 isoform X2 [Amborella trichopoda]|eukprot:XP_020519383.1 RHOMBOID-like protein 1 isoform X2 [Amborella trichopoda]